MIYTFRQAGGRLRGAQWLFGGPRQQLEDQQLPEGLGGHEGERRWALKKGLSKGQKGLKMIGKWAKRVSKRARNEDLEELYGVQDMCWEDFAIASNFTIKRSPEVQQPLEKRRKKALGMLREGALGAILHHFSDAFHVDLTGFHRISLGFSKFRI